MKITDTTVNLLEPALRNRLTSELKPDESIVWVGQPNPAHFGRGTKPLYFIGLLEIAGAGVCAMLAWRLFSNDTSRVGVLALAFMAFIQVVGAIVVFRFAMTVRRRAESTVYAISTRRAIVIEPPMVGSSHVRSYEAKDLERMTVRERPTGGGDILFHDEPSDDPERVIPASAFGFTAVDNVREVERLLREHLV